MIRFFRVSVLVEVCKTTCLTSLARKVPIFPAKFLNFFFNTANVEPNREPIIRENGSTDKMPTEPNEQW